MFVLSSRRLALVLILVRVLVGVRVRIRVRILVLVFPFVLSLFWSLSCLSSCTSLSLRRVFLLALDKIPCVH